MVFFFSRTRLNIGDTLALFTLVGFLTKKKRRYYKAEVRDARIHYDNSRK